MDVTRGGVLVNVCVLQMHICFQLKTLFVRACVCE